MSKKKLRNLETTPVLASLGGALGQCQPVGTSSWPLTGSPLGHRPPLAPGFTMRVKDTEPWGPPRKCLQDLLCTGTVPTHHRAWARPFLFLFLENSLKFECSSVPLAAALSDFCTSPLPGLIFPWPGGPCPFVNAQPRKTAL